MNKYFFNFSKHLIVIFFFTSISCHEKKYGNDINKAIEPSLLIEDVNFLIESLEKRHVDFYQRANKDSIKLIKEKIISNITKSMNRVEFFKIIARFNPYFNDAHCLVFPLTQEADEKKEKGFPLFPFLVKLNDNAFLVPVQTYIRTSDGTKLDKSNAITSINGIPTAHILETIQKYSHGETSILRKNMTTLLFSDWLFSLYGWCGEFKITLDNGTNIIVKTSDKWKSNNINVDQYNSMEILEDNIGYLKLGSFDVDEVKEDYEKFIDSSFLTLSKKKVEKLIIDVRGNTGGQSDAGALVLSYLTNKNLCQVSKAYDRIHEGNSGWFNIYGKPGELKTVDLSSDDLIKPVGNDKQFKGEVVVLFDEMTYSAGIIFITIIQDYNLAKTMGRPTAGFANQTGNIESFELPNSNLIVYVPSRKFVRVNGKTINHKVTPDIIITTKGKVNNAFDNVLDYAIQFLKIK